MEQSRTGSGSAVYKTGNEHPLPLDGEDENAYFEFQIHSHELTGSTSLQITDFAEQDEKKDSIDLWDTQVEELKRTLGI